MAFSLGRESEEEGESIGPVWEQATRRGKSRPRGRIGARMKLDCGRPNRRERRETGPVPGGKGKKRWACAAGLPRAHGLKTERGERGFILFLFYFFSYFKSQFKYGLNFFEPNQVKY